MTPTDRDDPVILGLAAGHDASACVIRGNRVLSHVLKERVTRRRHDWGVGQSLIDLALKDAGVTLGQVRFCALTGTQTMPLVFTEDFVDYAPRPDGPLWGWRPHHPASGHCHLTAADDAQADALTLDSARHDDPGSPAWQRAIAFLEHCATARGLPTAGFPQWRIDTYLSPLYGPARWAGPTAVAGLPDAAALTWLAREDHHAGMHRPITVTLGGRPIPGAFVSHHACHAASSYHSSPFDRALVVTADGGLGLEAGFVFLGEGGRLRPLAPHHLECGQFFDHVGHAVGLSYVGAAGKLMALASYGRQTLHHEAEIGSRADWNRVTQGWPGATTYDRLVQAWLARSGHAALPRHPLDPPGPDLARTAQAVLEATVTAAVAGTGSRLRQAGAEVDHLCLSGGVALNCPANTRLWREGGFSRVHVEPHCDDGGLSLGAAWWLQHTLVGTPTPTPSEPGSRHSARGPRHRRSEEDLLLEEQRHVLRWTPATAADIAADLAADRIVAVHEGRSETGPRALGHRSILADPRRAANWVRVNHLKRREHWRPFAPVTRQPCLPDHFGSGPAASPFMQFTHRVRRPDLLPAITHVDGTSRVQTVTADDGPLWEILLAFEALTGSGVLLNTSFNGPGEPIIEHAREALHFLRSNPGLDVLYLNGRRVIRAAG